MTLSGRKRIALLGILILLFSLLPRADVKVLGASSDTGRADLSEIETAVIRNLKEKIPEPAFGAQSEWTVFCLARSGFLSADDPYFASYYEAVKSAAKSKLSSTRSTENSRLILALSAIGKSAENVGGANLLQPYSDFDWIKKQGVNGAAFTLLAFDSAAYDTPDKQLREQCIAHILSEEKEGGGFALMGDVADCDITSMVLTALRPYRDRPEVAAAAKRAIKALSEMELPDGNFITLSYGTSVPTASSTAQVVTALSAWGIDADTDPRFRKEEGSVVDALLSFYVDDEDGPGFMNALPGSSDMSTTAGKRDPIASYQCAYALEAYRRFKEGRPALYDFSDITIEKAEPVREVRHETLILCLGGGACLVFAALFVFLLRWRRKRASAAS